MLTTLFIAYLAVFIPLAALLVGMVWLICNFIADGDWDLVAIVIAPFMLISLVGGLVYISKHNAEAPPQAVQLENK